MKHAWKSPDISLRHFPFCPEVPSQQLEKSRCVVGWCRTLVCCLPPIPPRCHATTIPSTSSRWGAHLVYYSSKPVGCHTDHVKMMPSGLLHTTGRLRQVTAEDKPQIAPLFCRDNKDSRDGRNKIKTLRGNGLRSKNDLCWWTGEGKSKRSGDENLRLHLSWLLFFLFVLFVLRVSWPVVSLKLLFVPDNPRGVSPQRSL